MLTSVIRVEAAAKLNLALDVTGKREDGYHTLDMIMQSVDLVDELFVSAAAEKGIRVASNFRHLPTDGRNLVCKAAAALAAEFGVEPALEIRITKRIPSQSGMGGGSADAAAALVALDRLWGLGLGRAKLAEIGLSLGSDVPFFLAGGTKRVSGIGEIVADTPQLADGCFLVALPRFGNPTKEIFARFDSVGGFERPDVDAAAAAIARGDLPALAAEMKNSLYAAAKTDELDELLGGLLEGGALGATMTGSGSAVFGLFADYCAASRASAGLKKKARRVFLVRPVRSSLTFPGER